MRRRLLTLFALTLALMTLAGPALACGGLLSPNGSVNLLRTTTLAAYHDGIEHYITSFRFVGGGGAKFGSIVPLPGVPTDVVKAGDWTLQRLIREVRPPAPEARVFAATADSVAGAKELLNVSIDALDITVLEGGAAEVAKWATDKGFLLSPDAPEVLDFYASRSPIFLAARFDSKRAADQGLAEGDGTPIHVIMPTPNPWVPLRILGLGKQATEPIQADVFLLTDRRPAMLPAAIGDTRVGELIPRTSGMRLSRSEWASEQLLADLRSDKGMEWLPAKNMWLTFLEIDTPAGVLGYDLAIDASGADQPSYVAAGLTDALARVREIVSGEAVSWVAMMALGAVAGAIAGYVIRRRVATTG
ncbi:MAG TPA: DUF2330 domain-containing protein [Actinomycetota bacterium]|nr:DUF2330 domain-containing protein [Actinomycetota bacterium]